MSRVPPYTHKKNGPIGISGTYAKKVSVHALDQWTDRNIRHLQKLHFFTSAKYLIFLMVQKSKTWTTLSY